MTTSKLILHVDFVVAIILNCIAVYVVFNSLDATQIVIMAGFWDVQLTAAIGFYYWKAKNENRSKYAMQLVKDLAEKYGIENVINLAQVILKD